jgi:hypothetical protein
MTVPMTIRTLQPPPQAVLCPKVRLSQSSVFPKSPNKPFYQIGREFAPLSPLRWVSIDCRGFLEQFSQADRLLSEGRDISEGGTVQARQFRSRRVLPVSVKQATTSGYVSVIQG